jgi:hypothetical protein
LYKNKYGQIIGHGEDVCVSILKDLYPDADIKIQWNFSKLMKGDFVGAVTERQEKETLDIVVFREKQMPIVVRVQDAHHSGSVTADRDKVQKKTLEWNDCVVVDVQHYNCPNIFKDKTNEESRRELLEAFADEGIVF